MGLNDTEKTWLGQNYNKKWSDIDPYELARTRYNRKPKRPFEIKWCCDLVRDAPISWGLAYVTIDKKYDRLPSVYEIKNPYTHKCEMGELLGVKYQDEYGFVQYIYFIPFDYMDFLIENYKNIKTRDEMIEFLKDHYLLVKERKLCDDGYVKTCYNAEMIARSIFDRKYRKNGSRLNARRLHIFNNELPEIKRIYTITDIA